MRYMRALCYKCGHSWNYKGEIKEGKKYITCSGCYYKIRIDRALDFSTEEHQKLLTNSIKLPSLPIKLPTYYSLIQERSLKPSIIKFEDKEEETIVPDGGVEEQMPVIKIFNNLSDFNIEILRKSFESKTHYPKTSFKILSSPLPSSVQKAIHEKEQEVKDPLLNSPKEEPNFEIRILPRDVMAVVEHQKEYGLNIANII